MPRTRLGSVGLVRNLGGYRLLSAPSFQIQFHLKGEEDIESIKMAKKDGEYKPKKVSVRRYVFSGSPSCHITLLLHLTTAICFAGEQEGGIGKEAIRFHVVQVRAMLHFVALV